jgi:hypothetical protein
MRRSECTLLAITGQGRCSCCRQEYMYVVSVPDSSSLEDLLMCILKGTKISEHK